MRNILAFLISLVIINSAYAETDSKYLLAQTGGYGGNGGAANAPTIQQCNVPGACVSVGNAKGGNGGAGGSVYGDPQSEDSAVGSGLSSISSCNVEIAGKTIIDGSPCKFNGLDGRGSFTLWDPSDRKKYRVRVNVDASHQGYGELSGGGSGATRSLGLMSGSGACWVNQDSSVRVCAYR